MADQDDARNSSVPPADHALRDGVSGMRQRVLRRFGRQRWALVALILVLIFLAAVQPVDWVDLLLGFVVFVIILALAPDGIEVLHPDPDTAGLTTRSFDETLFRVGEAVGLPWVIIDERNVVQQVNALAARQFAKLELGVPISLSLRNPVLVSAIETCRRTGANQTVEMHQTIPTQVFFRLHVAPISPLSPSSSQTPRQWIVVTFTDVTEQRRIDAMRSDFIANASHELRTPLTSVIGFIETLRGPAARDAAARDKFLGIMANQAERMSKLIDDLMSLSRIESRQHLTPSGTVDLKGILDEVAEGLQPQAQEAGVTITRDLMPSAVVIAGDRTELYEVFENLVENAVKYGGSGGAIEIALKPATGRPGYAYCVSVTDHGPGIAEEHVPRLTERFYRVDAESSRKKKGTGLGLAIVKHIVNRHRGVMTIRSELGKGTSVEVLLPS